MTVVLSLAAALLYGIGDFAGGFGSRRLGASTLLLWSYPIGAVLMTALLFAFPGQLHTRVALLGVGGGAAGVLGVLVMYHLMTMAPINVISPVTAVLAAIVPVFVGFGVGERPATAAWFGIALGLVSVVLVSRSTPTAKQASVGGSTLALALLSGLGFGLYFVCLGRAGPDAGLWPLTISRITSALLIMPFAWRARGFVLVRGRSLAIAAAAGTLDAFANLFFLLATHHGLLSVASVLTSLYPATTVLLAVTLLHERLNAVQRVGLVLAAGAIVLITV
ncbi:EamA family transporter [uncultured Jatrophihabitans sp.]|uniref:EamA family transporter n=1 Tax=uncultured Jatrophihabitans sp. TaxID=1610747 RepID=UPI0035CBF8F2